MNLLNLFWKKKTDQWGDKTRTVTVEIEHTIHEWDITIDPKQLEIRVMEHLKERIALEIVNEIDYSYDDEFREMFAKNMLKDKDVGPMIKQAFIEYGSDLLRRR